MAWWIDKEPIDLIGPASLEYFHSVVGEGGFMVDSVMVAAQITGSDGRPRLLVYGDKGSSPTMSMGLAATMWTDAQDNLHEVGEGD